VHAHLVEQQLRAFDAVERHLATRTFLVGERITLADITLATGTASSVAVTLDAATRPKYPNTIRHLETVAYHPLIKPAFGPINFAETAMQYVPPPKEKKEPKPAAEPKPKAEKKKKAAEEDEEEDDDLVPKEEPKAKNPLDSLPKSNFNLEDWKRAYSNKDTRGAGGSLEWFYEQCVPMRLLRRAADPLPRIALTRRAFRSGAAISNTTRS
jgi:elongation factor 1-gamma